MEDENKKAAPATPATGAPAENTAANVNPAPESAPENKETDKGNTKQGGDTAAAGKDGLPSGVKKRLWEQSEKVRKYEARIAELEAKAASVAPAPVPAPDKPAEPVAEIEPLDDLKKWGSSIKEQAKSEAKAEILADIKREVAEKKIVAEAKSAKEFLLSKPEFGSEDNPNEEAITEIQSIVASEEVQAICSNAGPMKGAEYAFYLWQKSKGLDPASVAKANDNAAKSGAPTPSGNTSGGKKVWTPSQVEAYLKDYKSPDFKARHAEILLAQKEGRIKV